MHKYHPPPKCNAEFQDHSTFSVCHDGRLSLKKCFIYFGRVMTFKRHFRARGNTGGDHVVTGISPIWRYALRKGKYQPRRTNGNNVVHFYFEMKRPNCLGFSSMSLWLFNRKNGFHWQRLAKYAKAKPINLRITSANMCYPILITGPLGFPFFKPHQFIEFPYPFAVFFLFTALRGNAIVRMTNF